MAFFYEGDNRDLSAWVVCDDGNQERIDCPKYCKVDAIKACFHEKEVGGVYAVCSDVYGLKYKIHFIKEAEYILKLFSTYGLLSKRCR